MKRLGGLVNRWVESRLNSANFQEEIDTLKVFGLLQYNQWYKTKAVDCTEERKPNFDTNVKYRRQRDYIDRTFDQELEKIFEYVHQMGGMDPYPAPIIPKQIDEENLSYEEIAARRLDVLTEEEARKQEREIADKPIKHPDGYTIQIQHSSIEHPEAGFGVHVIDGTIQPGSIISLYPGVIYTQPDFSELKESDYIISGYDGVVIDGKGWSDKAIEQRRQLRHSQLLSSHLSLLDDNRLKKYRNPFAIGQYINHPPADKKANVIAFPHLFGKNFPEHLKHYIPHTHKNPPKWYLGFSSEFRTSIIVATSKIVPGDELFLNYRYNPKFAYPPWYHQPDIEEATRRWAPTRIIYF